MNLEYNAQGKFVPETQKLIEELKADAVLLLVFGSRSKGSGACCELRVSQPESLALVIVEQLRALADAIESDIDQLDQKGEVIDDDQDRHEQEKQQYRARGLRPGESGLGDHL